MLPPLPAGTTPAAHVAVTGLPTSIRSLHAPGIEDDGAQLPDEAAPAGPTRSSDALAGALESNVASERLAFGCAAGGVAGPQPKLPDAQTAMGMSRTFG